MSVFIDILSLLDLPSEASDSDIKKAFQKKAAIWHPDKNDGVHTENFTKLSSVYNIWRKLGEEERLRHRFQAKSGRPIVGVSKDRPVDVPLRKVIRCQYSELFSPLHVTVDMEYWTFCPKCQSCGCLWCHHRGYLRDQTTGSFTLPVGTLPGDIQRFEFAGRTIELDVAIDFGPLLRRDGLNLGGVLKIDAISAMIGQEVLIPFFKRTLSLKVPAGTSSGTLLRIPKKGLPGKDGSVGDLLYDVQLYAPAITDQMNVEYLQNLRQMIKT